MDDSLLGVEPQEVDAVLRTLVGDRDDDDALFWHRHLSSRQALLIEAVDRIKDMRAEAAAEIYQEMGDKRSYAKLAAVLGCSRSLAQQAIEQARALDAS